ncbi:hypothetical protein AKJ16_DCAP15771 [Drosera capensis]
MYRSVIFDRQGTQAGTEPARPPDRLLPSALLSLPTRETGRTGPPATLVEIFCAAASTPALMSAAKLIDRKKPPSRPYQMDFAQSKLQKSRDGMGKVFKEATAAEK